MHRPQGYKMTQFQDTSQTPPRIFDVDDSITFQTDANGFYRFYRDGVDLNWPNTFVPYVAPVVPLTLAELQANQVAAISMACQSQIVGGFSSSALGSDHTYPSGAIDQANMNANVVSSLLPNLPANWTTQQVCANSNGVWAYRAHTAAQIRQVGDDGKAAILACLLKNDSLRSQINAIADPNPTNPSAQTIAAIAAITW